MRLTLILLATLLAITCPAQKPTINWGEEFKFRRGSTDLAIIHADKDGVYLQEGHTTVKIHSLVALSPRQSGALVKLDKNLSELYRNDFIKELAGKEFQEFFVLGDKMFLFSSEYLKREKVMNIYAAEINKKSGQLAGNWKPVASFQKNEKSDDINFKLAYSADSSKIVLVSTVEGKARNEYKVQEFDKAIKPVGKSVVISNEFDSKTFQLEDVVYTSNQKIILVGRVYEFKEGKKRKEKFLDFANYNIRMYDASGQQIAEINTTVDGKWITSAKVIQERDRDLVLTAFYNSNCKEKTIDGYWFSELTRTRGK